MKLKFTKINQCKQVKNNSSYICPNINLKKRKRERERETDRQTDRQTDRDRESERGRERQTETERAN